MYFFRFAVFLFIMAFVGNGCRPESNRVFDPTSTYEAFGASFMPDGAVPIQAVIAELDVYVGRMLKLEGKVIEVTSKNGGWLELETGDSCIVRVFLPTSSVRSSSFSFPVDITGRRVVVRGTLRTASSANPTQQQDLDESTSDHEESRGRFRSRLELELRADGILVEKVRV